MIGDVIDRVSDHPDVEDVVSLLSAEGRDLDRLFEASREVRDRTFGNRVFTYGFVYFSTYCRNDCSFCYYRRSNRLERYRKGPEEVISVAGGLRDSGVDLVDITMGEDPVMCADGHGPFTDLVGSVRDAVGDLGIMASPGVMSAEGMVRLREAGADWFACYQETHNLELFSRMRPGQDFDTRMAQKRMAHSAGLLAEDGMMIGIGETVEDRARTIIGMGALGCEQVRAMTFVPQAGTPMSGVQCRDPTDERRAIAVMRLLYPDRLIPASLDVEGLYGLGPRIDAGANVVTSIVSPDTGLAGVAQHELDIGNGNRSVGHVFATLDELGFRPATVGEYRAYMESRRGKAR